MYRWLRYLIVGVLMLGGLVPTALATESNSRPACPGKIEAVGKNSNGLFFNSSINPCARAIKININVVRFKDGLAVGSWRLSTNSNRAVFFFPFACSRGVHSASMTYIITFRVNKTRTVKHTYSISNRPKRVRVC